MKKLRLSPENLRVESFDAGAGTAGGTVVAHDHTSPIIVDDSRVNSCYLNTCYEGCDWTD